MTTPSRKQDEAKPRPIPLLRRIPSTVRKILTRSRRPAYTGAPAAFEMRMVWFSLVAILLALSVSPWDEQLSRQAVASPNVFLRFLAVYTDIGKSAAYLLTAFAIMTWLSLSDWRAHNVSIKARLALIYAQAAFAFGAIAGSGIVVNIFKFIFARARPKFLDELGPYDFFGRMGVGYDFSSFPSGHSTTMGALGAILALWFPKLRIVTIPAAFMGAVSRVAVGAHFPSDVIIGFALGFLFTLFLARLLARRHSVFRLGDGALFPRPQFSGSFSR